MTQANDSPDATGGDESWEHGLSVDVEDYRQILSLRFRGQSGAVSDTFQRDMDATCELLARSNTAATFFVTGTIVQQRKDLVRGWADLGHEIASHGFAHKPIWLMSSRELAEELKGCKAAIEDAIGRPICGFRAPIFSVRWDSLWALEVISQAGFTYDSSIVPVLTRRYGVSGFPPSPARYELSGGRAIVEIPLTAGKVLGRDMPVAGGGYFRLLPFSLIRKAVARCQQDNRTFVMYCHPDELGGRRFRCADLAAGTPDKLAAGLISLKSNIGRKRMPGIVRRLLSEFRFGTLGQIARRVAVDGPTRLLAETCPPVRRPV